MTSHGRSEVATLRQEAHRIGTLRVVGRHVQLVARVERPPLRVQSVARILDGQKLILRDELDVVEAGVGLVCLIEDRDRTDDGAYPAALSVGGTVVND